MLRDNDGYFNRCPFKAHNGVLGPCIGEDCAAYDIIPAQYNYEGKPVERCLMMNQTPFFVSYIGCPANVMEENHNG